MCNATGLSETPGYASVETMVLHGVQWLHLALDAVGAMIIAVGTVAVVLRLTRRVVRGDTSRLTNIRLVLARFLTLALEIQLAADVLATAIAPDWRDIGELAAIAVIRTALNLSLTREIANERKDLAEDDGGRKSHMSTAAP